MQDKIYEQTYEQIYESCKKILKMILVLDPDFDMTCSKKFYESQPHTINELFEFEKEILGELVFRVKYSIFDREALARQNKFLTNMIREIND